LLGVLGRPVPELAMYSIAAKILDLTVLTMIFLVMT
jgi:hypothetical protein